MTEFSIPFIWWEKKKKKQITDTFQDAGKSVTVNNQERTVHSK